MPALDAPRDERKSVTLLQLVVPEIVDDATGGLAPATRHALAAEVHELVEQGATQFGARVLPVEDHHYLAVFGAPQAHEHHAQFACYAALLLRNEMERFVEHLAATEGIRLTPRIVLDVVDVLVRKSDACPQGEVVIPQSRARLLEALAHFTPAGQVYATASLAERVADFLHLEPRGRIRGAEAPQAQALFAVTGVAPHQTRFDAARARGLSPLVGREGELASLERSLDLALKGRGQFVTLEGPPGVGRSRLCHEFVARCRARGVAVFETRGVPAGQALPFMPVLGLVRSYFGIADTDTPSQIRAKLFDRLTRLSGRLMRDYPLLAAFLGAADADHPPPANAREGGDQALYGAFRRLITAQAQAEPTVIVLEDIDAFDRSSAAALAYDVAHVAEVPVLLLATHRADYQRPWQETFAWTRIELEPLAPEASRVFLRRLLGDRADIASVAEDILERTGGNPLFMEELVRTMAQAGALTGTPGAYRLGHQPDRALIPHSVEETVTARVDALPPRQKLALQTAAVIGREFSQDVLQRVLPWPAADVHATLRELVDAAFVVETGYYPHVTFAFRHPLTHEVVDESQPAAGRRTVHEAVAQALAALHADAPDPHAAVIAEHFARGGAALEAARWRARAGRHAGLSDPATALEQWRAVRRLLDAEAETPEAMALRLEACTWLLQYGWRLGLPLADAEAIYAEGRVIAMRTRATGAHAMLAAAYAFIHCLRGNPAMLPLSEEARLLATQTGDAGLILAVQGALAMGYFSAGRLRQAHALLDRLLAAPPTPLHLGAEYIGFPPYIACFGIRASVWMHEGHLHRAREDFRTGLRLATEHGADALLVWMHSSAAECARIGGEPDLANQHARAAMELSERLGDAASRHSALRGLGQARSADGAWAEAAEAFGGALQLTRERGIAQARAPKALVGLARARLQLGEEAAAIEAAAEATRLAREQGNRVFECEALLMQARVLMCTRGAAAAEELETILDAAQAALERTGAQRYAALLRMQRAALAILTGDESARRAELGRAHQLYTEMGAPVRAAAVAAA